MTCIKNVLLDNKTIDAIVVKFGPNGSAKKLNGSYNVKI